MTMTDLAPNLLHKVLPATGVKTIDEEQGIVEAFVSGIGNKDQVADIIEKGAFIDSLKERMPKGVWSHDWSRPVSKTLEIYEVPAGDDRLPKKMLEAGIGGLYVKTQFNLETQDGRDALSWVKFFGEDSEWSIGYQTKESEYDAKKKAMRLKKIDLYEYSPVLFGANPLTSTVGVKVLINQEGQEKAVDLVLEGVDPELAAKIQAAVESVVANDGEEDTLDEKGEVVPEAKTGEEQVADDVETPPDPEVKEGEEVDSKETEESEAKASEGAADESGEPADPDGSESLGDEKSGEPEDGSGEWTPAPVVEYVEKMLLAAELSPRDAKALNTFINSRVRANEEGVYPDGTKSLPGSWEERRGALNDCLEEKYPGGSSWVYATFDNTVVFRVYNYLTGEGSYYEATYSMGDDDVELSDVKEVDIIEVVVAKAAVMDAVFKGHGLEIKKLLQPLVELSADVEPDDDIKTVLELALKAGASLSAVNRQKIQEAIDTISAASSALGELIKTEEKEDEHDEEVISVANKAGASPTFGKANPADDEAEEKADSEDEIETVAVDLDEFKKLQEELGLA